MLLHERVIEVVARDRVAAARARADERRLRRTARRSVRDRAAGALPRLADDHYFEPSVDGLDTTAGPATPPSAGRAARSATTLDRVA